MREIVIRVKGFNVRLNRGPAGVLGGKGRRIKTNEKDGNVVMDGGCVVGDMNNLEKISLKEKKCLCDFLNGV